MYVHIYLSGFYMRVIISTVFWGILLFETVAGFFFKHCLIWGKKNRVFKDLLTEQNLIIYNKLLLNELKRERVYNKFTISKCHINNS